VPISHRELARKPRRAGFVEIRTSRHPVYYSADRDLTVPIPMHLGDVPKGTLRSIIRQMRITVEDFNAPWFTPEPTYMRVRFPLSAVALAKAESLAQRQGQRGVQRGKAPLVGAIFGRRGNPTAEEAGGRLPSGAPRRALPARSLLWHHWKRKIMGASRGEAHCRLSATRENGAEQAARDFSRPIEPVLAP